MRQTKHPWLKRTWKVDCNPMINYETLRLRLNLGGLTALRDKNNHGGIMRNLITAFFLSVSLLTFSPVQAASLRDVIENKIILSFPETATFQLTVSKSVEINSVVLEYGREQQICGEVVAKALPQFTTDKTVNTEWTWEMRQSGSLPPGARPHPASAQPTAQPTPAFVPTFVPISSRPFALQETVTSIPTSTLSGHATQESPVTTRNAPPLSLTLILLGLCCALLLVIGIFVLGFVLRYQNMNEGKNDQK